jgi:hypothetical protein
MKVLAALILCSVLLFSCRPAKSLTKDNARTESVKDSVINKVTVKLDTVRVKAETAQVAIPFELLRDSVLNYMEQSNGRAKVIIQRVGNNIVATAKCDSLEKIIASKDVELLQWKQYALQQISKTESVKIDVPIWFKAGLFGLCALLIISIINSFLPFNRLFNGKK